MHNLTELTKWHGPHWRGHGPQAVPSCEDLLGAGAVPTGDYLPDDDDCLPVGRDKRTWYVESPGGNIVLLLVPDERGFFLEDEDVDRWRPANLREMIDLLWAMEVAHTIAVTH
jgi:hypothetical protein